MNVQALLRVENRLTLERLVAEQQAPALVVLPHEGRIAVEAKYRLEADIAYLPAGYHVLDVDRLAAERGEVYSFSTRLEIAPRRGKTYLCSDPFQLIATNSICNWYFVRIGAVYSVPEHAAMRLNELIAVERAQRQAKLSGIR